jgi:hypothetical protein
MDLLAYIGEKNVCKHSHWCNPWNFNHRPTLTELPRCMFVASEKMGDVIRKETRPI